MRTRSMWSVLLVGLVGCGNGADSGSDAERTAQRFFRAVYGCSGEPLDSLAHPDVRMSYPIFADRLGTPVLEGRTAVQEFSRGFCQRWSEPSVTIHETISDAEGVVLVWGYAATSMVEGVAQGTRVQWGGISVFLMDELGRVVAEFGEESTPGPVERMRRWSPMAGDSL